MRRVMLGIALSAMIVTGCTESDRNPFPTKGQYRPDRDSSSAMLPTASVKAATRLDAIGAQVVAANQADIGAKPQFFAVGIDKPLAFHRGTNEIVVSEGMISKCQTDAELAAVISHQLGKMIAERETKNPKRNTEMQAPPSPRVTGDALGFGFDPDMTRRAEEAIYTRRQQSAPRFTGREVKIDPATLARNYLSKAGHPADELQRMEPLLKEADANAADRDFMK